MFDSNNIFVIGIYSIFALFIIIIMIFVPMLIWDIGKENIIERIGAIYIGMNASVSPETVQYLEEYSTVEKEDINLDFDIIFFLFYSMVFIGLVSAAYFAPALPKVAFVTILFFFNLVAGLLISYTDQIITWFMDNLFLNFFPDEGLVILEHFIENYGWYAFILVNAVFFANQARQFFVDRRLAQ